jgi:hypothetical protein
MMKKPQATTLTNTFPNVKHLSSTVTSIGMGSREVPRIDLISFLVNH